MSALPFSSSVEESVININLDTMLVNTMLLGIYTVVYFGTLYIYLNKKSSQHWLIVGTISVMYFVYVAQTAVAWFITKRAFINNGQTQDSIFFAIFVTPLWGTFVNDICYYLIAALADGLLIWRCYNVWDRSLRVISVSLFLLFCEICLNWAIIIMAAALHLNPSPSQAQTLNQLTGAVLFMTLGTNLVTTLLISYRIHVVTQQDLLRGSKARFKHILEILVQSAALYSVVTLTAAVPAIVPFPTGNFVPLIGAQDYTSIFYVFTAGFAPTVMVARVAFTNDKDPDVTVMTHISGLQFQGSTTSNATQLGRDPEEPQSPDSAQEQKDLNRKEGGGFLIA